MKPIFVSIALFFIVISVSGQPDSIRKHISKWSVGTILLNEKNSFFSEKFNGKYFPGIIVKTNFKHYSLRLAFEYVKEFSRLDEDIVPYPDQMFVEGYMNEGMIRMGIEKGIVFKKYFKPYMAIDITGVKGYSDLTYTGGFAGVNDRIYSHFWGYGACPSVGIEFIISKNISFVFESRYRFVYTTTNSEIHSLNHYSPPYKVSDKHLNKDKYRIGAFTLFVNF